MSEAIVDHLARARSGYQFVKTNLIAGLVFMVPLAVLVFFGAKIVGLLQRLAKPLAALFPVETTVWGVVVADAIVVALLLLACFLCGLLTRVSLATHFVKKAESGVLWRLPGYGFVKALTDSFDKRGGEGAMKPVLIHFDDSAQLAFEVEQLPDGRRMIYVPSSPDPRAGTVMVMDAARVEPVQISYLAALRAMRALGKGASAYLSAPPAASSRSPETR